MCSQFSDQNNKDRLCSTTAGILLHSRTGWGASVDRQSKCYDYDLLFIVRITLVSVLLEKVYFYFILSIFFLIAWLSFLFIFVEPKPFSIDGHKYNQNNKQGIPSLPQSGIWRILSFAILHISLKQNSISKMFVVFSKRFNICDYLHY